MVVLQTSDSTRYRRLSAEIAEERGERVVTDPEAVRADETVVYVDPPTDISEATLVDLLARDNGIETGGVGVITGRTPEEARALANRSATDDLRHALLVRMINDPVPYTDDDATLLTGDEATVERLEEVCSGDVSSLSMLTNATDIHAFLDEGYICGFPRDPGAFTFEGLQPPCVVDGDRDCIFDGDLVLAEDLATPHMFLDACTSPLANNNVGLPVNLGLALLAEATSVVAPFRMIVVQQYQVALHYALLRAGYTAAERAALLNRSLVGANFEFEPFVAFGQPEAAIDASTTQSFDVEYTATTDGYRIVATDVDAHVLDFTVPADGFGNQETFFLRTASDERDREIFYTAFREGQHVRVVVCSAGRLQEAEMTFALAESSLLDESPYVPNLGDVEARVDVGLISGKARGQLKNARNVIAGAADYREREPYLATAHESIRERLRQADGSLRNARESLLVKLCDRGTIHLREEYSGKTYPVDTYRCLDECPYCGRDVFVRDFTDVYDRVRRSKGVCPKCSYIYDVPSRDEPIYPTLGGDFTPISSGETGRIELSFTNPLDRPLEAAVAVTPTIMDYPGDVISPSKESIAVAPGETATVPFSADTSDLDPELYSGRYWLEGYVVTDDLQVYEGMRTMYVHE